MEKEEKIELAKEILKITAELSVITATMVIAPAAVGVVGKLFIAFENYESGEKWQYRSQAKQAIKRLEKRGLVVTESKGEELVIKITQAGRRWLKHYEITHLSINRPVKWDGYWRIVTFDIPEDHHQVRDTVRSWLKRLGFARLQKSVWVIPWPCQKQFDLLASEYKLGTQAILLESKKIAREASLKRIFKL